MSELKERIQVYIKLLKEREQIISELNNQNRQLKQFIKGLKIVPTSYFAEETRILVINYKDEEKIQQLIKELP